MPNGLGDIPRYSDRKKPRADRPLTPTQARVLELHDAGMTQAQIARALGWNVNRRVSGIRIILDAALGKVGRAE